MNITQRNISNVIALGFWEVKVKAWFKDSELEAAM